MERYQVALGLEMPEADYQEENDGTADHRVSRFG